MCIYRRRNHHQKQKKFHEIFVMHVLLTHTKSARERPTRATHLLVCWLAEYSATITNKNRMTHSGPRFSFFYYHFCFECAFYLVMKRMLLSSSSSSLLYAFRWQFFVLHSHEIDVKVVATTFLSSETNRIRRRHFTGGAAVENDLSLFA